MIRFLLGMKRLSLAVCLLGALSLACSKSQVTKPEPTPEEHVNPYKPNANARILAQSVIGDPTSYSSIYDLAADATGQYSFRGGMNNRWGAGILTSSGSVVRLETTIYSARGLCGLSAAAPAPNAFLVVGAHDNDGDPGSDVGYASLFSSSGGLLDQLLISSDTSDVWLSAVGQVTDSTFVAAGGERRGGTTYPYLALLAVTSEKRVALRARAVVPQPTRYLYGGNVAVFPPSPGGNELFLSVLSTGQGQANRIEGIRATLPDLDPVSVEWSREVVGQTGPQVSLRQLQRVSENLVVVGNVDDNRKQPAPSGGGYWDSGLAASYTTTGALRWQTVVSLSGTDEWLRDVCAGADALYAVGTCASYVRIVGDKPQDVLCYGLVSKIDLNTGQVIENMSLGQDRFSAGFDAAAYSDGALTCVGWTEFETSGGPYRAWFCRIGTGGSAPLASSTPGPALESLRASVGAIPPARPRDREAAWR